jgi:hypothetical protein
MSTGRVIRLGGPRSISGHAIHGKKLVRFIYLDEAGLSRIEEEPFLVVAGVILHPDTQWRQIDLYLRDVVADVWPDDNYGGRFVFHAKDIWHGAKQFKRSEWTKTQRIRLLKRLAAIPAKFSLPIIYGVVDRRELEERLPRHTKLDAHNTLMRAYAEAFHIVIRRAEDWLKRNTEDETAMLMVENSTKVRSVIKMIHGGYLSKTPCGSNTFISNHVIDAPNLIDKDESTLLQLADHCAFILKRKIMERQDIEELYQIIAPQVHHDIDARSHAIIRIHQDKLRVRPGYD